MENLFVFIGTFLCVSMGEARPVLRQLEHGDHNLCKILRAPDNGRLEFPPKFESGSWIVLWCPIGGNTTRTFLQNGTLDDILRKRIDQANTAEKKTINKSRRRKRGENTDLAKLPYGNDKFNGEEKTLEDLTNSHVGTDRGNNANTCIMPRIPQYGRMDYPDNITHFSPGTKVTYSCNDGYALRGQSSRECLPTGQWNSPPPDCQVNLCKPPVTHVHGGVVIQADQIYTTDTEITHICKDGFEMKGDSKQGCLNNGLWSGEVPDCIEKKWYKTDFIWIAFSVGFGLGFGLGFIVVLMIKQYACMNRLNTTTTHSYEMITKQRDETKLSKQNGPINKPESEPDLSRSDETVNKEGKNEQSLIMKVKTPSAKMIPPRPTSVTSTGTKEIYVPNDDDSVFTKSPAKEENEPKQAYASDNEDNTIKLGRTVPFSHGATDSSSTMDPTVDEMSTEAVGVDDDSDCKTSLIV